MASITAWIARLVEAELDEVITWKNIKPDPGASGKDSSSRFSDDGSNFRSVVGSPPLDSESIIQLLEKPGSNARAKILVSDGEVSMLATLSDSAWAAYDSGIEEEDGDEPRKGDLLLCKRVTVVSTTYGPSEERVKLRIDDLELTGNFRKVIGKPKSLLQRPAITKLCESIGAIRRRQQDADLMEEDDEEDQNDEEEVVVKQEDEDDDTGNGRHLNDANQRDEQDLREHTANSFHDVLPTAGSQPEPHVDQLVPHTSRAVSRTALAFQVESQLPVEALRSQLPEKQRNPVRRNRGGYSGVEQTRGDNLTGPQAPTLHQKQAHSPIEPPQNKLLGMFSKMPAHVPRKRSPEPSAPVSAQVANEEMVLDTPTKAKSSPSAPKPTPVQHRRCRIPREQKELLDSPSSWIPSAPAQQFPHPNVPIKLLRAWNDKAVNAPAKSSTQPSPIALVEQTPGARSIQEVVPANEMIAAESHVSLCDGSTTSEDEPSDDEPLPWSQSQGSQALPPDSSAAHSPTRASDPTSQGFTQPTNGHTRRPPLTSQRDVEMSSSNSIDRWNMTVASHSPAGIQRRSPTNTLATTESDREQHFGIQTASQSATQSRPTPAHRNILPVLSSSAMHTPKRSRSEDDNAEWPPDSQHAAEPRSAPPLRNALAVPAGSMQPPASQPVTRTHPSRMSSNTPARGANARPVQTPDHRRLRTSLGSSQPVPAEPRTSRPLADNYHGPTQPSTQQPFEDRRRSDNFRSGFSPSAANSTPFGAPTGPRAIRGSQDEISDRRDSRKWSGAGGSSFGLSDRRNPNCRPDERRPPTSDFKRPPPSGPRSDSRGPANNNASQSGSNASQAPNGTATSEMEISVPRALPPANNYREERRRYMRDQQQRQWLASNAFPTNQDHPASDQSLLQRYREKYPMDPVTDQEFTNLINQLRPKPATTEPLAPPKLQPSRLTSQASSKQPQPPNNSNDRHHQSTPAKASQADHAHSPRAQNDTFAEFALGWKAIRPGGAFATKQDHRLESSGRWLNVLEWGFGV